MMTCDCCGAPADLGVPGEWAMCLECEERFQEADLETKREEIIDWEAEEWLAELQVEADDAADRLEGFPVHFVPGFVPCDPDDDLAF